ncbi:type II toxin-antitoxin system toxin DNA ADP-ribosyl transferase DarT [Deinococcus sp.]|uniref:type II toxin-antitoxin system toxin DNA ADP-ribosyl transferase DarT n=1 Tax=Deinococcus sp. TaxID=47478 RepID=UPI003CC5AFC3
MTTVPANQKIYHITHVDNLPAIIAAGELRSDALMLSQGGPEAMIGMSHIKKRRLEELSIPCLGGVMVGECVPFYFGPRSVMLYIINRGSADIQYRGGQGPIVHLEADLREALRWARAAGRPWAFSLGSAATRYTEFRNDLKDFIQVDWNAVQADDWRDSGVKERKQSEFLVKDTFPWSLVQRIGVRSHAIATQANIALQAADHQPLVQMQSSWYYP